VEDRLVLPVAAEAEARQAGVQAGDVDVLEEHAPLQCGSCECLIDHGRVSRIGRESYPAGPYTSGQSSQAHRRAQASL
jgi:hypothetical protein